MPHRFSLVNTSFSSSFSLSSVVVNRTVYQPLAVDARKEITLYCQVKASSRMRAPMKAVPK